MNPTPTQIKSARLAVGLNPADAAALVHRKARAWYQWEAGTWKMHPAFRELFDAKILRAQGLLTALNSDPNLPGPPGCDGWSKMSMSAKKRRLIELAWPVAEIDLERSFSNNSFTAGKITFTYR